MDTSRLRQLVDDVARLDWLAQTAVWVIDNPGKSSGLVGGIAVVWSWVESLSAWQTFLFVEGSVAFCALGLVQAINLKEWREQARKLDLNATAKWVHWDKIDAPEDDVWEKDVWRLIRITKVTLTNQTDRTVDLEYELRVPCGDGAMVPETEFDPTSYSHLIPGKALFFAPPITIAPQEPTVDGAMAFVVDEMTEEVSGGKEGLLVDQATLHFTDRVTERTCSIPITTHGSDQSD